MQPLRNRAMCTARRALMLVLFGIPLVWLESLAQPLDDLPAIRPMFGIGNDEFLIGGWCGVFPPSAFAFTDTAFATRTMTIRADDDTAAHVYNIWPWARDMGVNVLRRQMNWEFPDIILDTSSLRWDTNRLVLSNSGIIDEGGYGAEGHFFFTDSIRYREEPSAFAVRSGGSNTVNTIENDDAGADARDQVYSGTNTTANQLIADRPAFNWAAHQAYRWEWYNDGTWKQRPDTAIQNSDYYFRRPHYRQDSTYRINIKGHLQSGGSAASSASLIRVEIWYERARGANVRVNVGGVWRDSTWAVNDSVLVDSFSVTKQQLLPPDPNVANAWDEYQEVNHAFNSRLCANGASGPSYPGNSSQSFNIKVFWTGAETVALHSLSIRDSLAHLILTDDPTFRAAIRARAEEMVYRRGTARLRSVIGLSLGGEQPAIQAATAARVFKWVREWMNAARNPTQFSPVPQYGADSLPAWIEDGYPESMHRLYDIDFVSSEGGTNVAAWMKDLFSAPHYKVPSIRDHNGGRFTADTTDLGAGFTSLPLPALDLDTPATRLANLESYEIMLQRVALGHFVPVGGDLPYSWMYAKMARAAQVARDFRRRNIFIYFNVTPVGFDIRDSVGSNGIPHRFLDTIVGHIPEAAEQRAILNTALAYGNKGIHYQVLDAQTNVLGPPIATRNNLREGHAVDWGSNGPLTSDTLQDVVASIRFKERDANGWYGNTGGYDIPNFYVGWGNRTRETKRFNQWLRDSIGPLLMKLNWRDAYSIHYTVPQPYRLKKYRFRNRYDSIDYRSVGYRPIPSTEIITDVRSYRRDWVGNGGNRRDTLMADSLTRTYVELGLFYRKNSVGHQKWDTNWVMVVNRRAFERPDDIAATSTKGRLYDSLAEVRTITLKLSMLNFEEFNFVRVREMGADITPLPLSSTARAPLDTVLHADSIVRITLRPGGAALLRITYIHPDTSINGRLPFSNQRKIVWDPWQRRYHATFMMATEDSRIDSVCYRRSVPMTDSSGSILWESDTIQWSPSYRGYTLSRTNDPNDSIVFNRHPSLTIRRAPAGVTHPGGTMVTVVWTAHRVPIPYAGRQVLLRTLWSPDSTAPAVMDMPIEVVDSNVQGTPENAWGTPVISRTDGSDIISWSDSAFGIKAVARVMNDPVSTPLWWQFPAAYTDTIHVSAAQTARFGRPGKFPSVPTFAHIVSRDSNVAVVWEQATSGPVNNPTYADIYFKRLLHTVTLTADTLTALDSSLALLNPHPGRHRHPSITQHQDFWHEVQDFVVWEQLASFLWAFDHHVIWARSIFTETRSPSLAPPDVIIPKPQLWGHAAFWSPVGGLDWTYPNVASLTYRDSLDTRKARATIAHNYRYRGTSDYMAEVAVQWAAESMSTWRPYAYGGRYLNNSETPDSQRTRHAVLYEFDQAGQRKLRTTRQYYLGRARPYNYIASGRELSLRLNDSTASGLSIMLIDAWKATPTASGPIATSRRDTAVRRIDNFDSAQALLRSAAFAASDSISVGATVVASFEGDTTGYSALRATCFVELVDSVTGLVAHRLDSFRISTVNTSRRAQLTADLDVLSGTYYIRARIDTVGVVVPFFPGEGRYPVTEMAMFAADSAASFVGRRTLPGLPSSLRVTARPNPATASTEARFTVIKGSRVQVVLTNASGNFSTMLVDEWMEPGRYALEVNTEGLTPGSYLLRVRAGQDVGTAKVLVIP